MNQKTFLSAAGAIFLVISLLHLARAVFGWNAIIGGWAAPLWLSWLGLLVAGYLAYQAFTLSKK
ncbi:MAG: hypothetical protein HYS60_01310 [Candidatus Wildermuthbacteria bacterium]|nr:hypothetical protein [Candidatus Wildermuthbacteria bacterium]